MRALILGGTGMLGRALAEEGRRRNLAVLALSHRQLDVTVGARLAEMCRSFRPGLLINCAALTRVDACETRRREALAVNGRAVAEVVAAAAASQAGLVQVSTDYVFDGRARTPYATDAGTAPLNVYGASKLAGEAAALSYPRALVLRTSWVFGPGGNNFIRTLLRRLAQGETTLRVVDDQIGCPTYSRYLARAIWDLAEAGHTGVFHFRNREPVSWHGFASELARHWGSTCRVEPMTTAELSLPAARPAYSVLDVTRTEEALGRPVEPWLSGLTDYLERLRLEGIDR